MPLLKKAKKEGKIAFFRHTKLIIREKNEAGGAAAARGTEGGVTGAGVTQGAKGGGVAVSVSADGGAGAGTGTGAATGAGTGAVVL